MTRNVAIIGGGAAGFFSALSVKEHHPLANVTIYEKSSKLLSKVKVSGGGRCNVTNGETNIRGLLNGYPRGQKLLKQLLREFSTSDIIEWFESRDVKLKTEDDGRVFPISDNSQTIIDCLLREVDRKDVTINTSDGIQAMTIGQSGISLQTKTDSHVYDAVIAATGGSPKLDGFNWLAELDHQVIPPVPSLFTFNMPSNPITELKGVVCQKGTINIQGHKFSSSGPILITHWGMSGPAVLKLSSFTARELADLGYEFTVRVNWTGKLNEEEVRHALTQLIESNKKKDLGNMKPFDLPERLWHFLIKKIQLSTSKKMQDLGKKDQNKIINILVNDTYPVSGKTTFKEEFVTCGGISIDSINRETLESKSCKGLYFAGEVLDIDGITGGYNFQAAWTTAWIAGKLG